MKSILAVLLMLIPAAAHAETLDGRLPPANDAAYARFGGIDS